MRAIPSNVLGLLVSLAGAALLFLLALVMPERTLLVLPLLVLVMVALALYQFPIAFVAAFVLVYGLAVDIQLDVLVQSGAPGGDKVATLGGAILKVVPFALTAFLILRYGFSRAINWPFITFGALAAASIAILPMGHVIDTPEMVRSFIGSAAPFALGFARAPKRVWTSLVRGAALIPIISALLGLVTHAVGFYPAFDNSGRFQGLHSPPFLAGFCSTAIFAAVLEYLRGGYRTRWLVVAALDMVVLLATQARAPLGAVILFLLIVFLFSGRRVFPLQRKVDLVMVGVVPALALLAPFMVIVMDRFVGEGGEINFSGRDLILPYFTEAIANRPFFGYGLGAGKLIVNPEDPLIRLLGSNAAHNEYLRLSVDGGVIGCAAIFLSIAAWIWIGTREVSETDRMVLRAALAAVLLHSGFDNTLIATTGVIQFTFFAAAMARGRMEWRAEAGARAARRARSGTQGNGRSREGRRSSGEEGYRGGGAAAAAAAPGRGGTAFLG